MPGAVASDEGVIYGASAIDYIHGPNIKKDLEERLQTRVELENDANCAALAEVWLRCRLKIIRIAALSYVVQVLAVQ